MDAAGISQEMPPPGGYRKIKFERNPAKSYFRGGRLLAGFILFNSSTIYYYYTFHRPKIAHCKVETRGSFLATLPLLLAERDRGYLLQIRKNRDEEEKLMANVPGWEVGKFYGESIYKTVDDTEFINPSMQEFYAHSKYWDYYKRAHENLFAI